MPNKRYVAGRACEYLAKKELELEGYTVVRTSGSHGPCDLVAWKDPQRVRCIQVKKIKTERGRKYLLTSFKGYANGKRVDELWVRQGGKWHKSHDQVG